MTFTALLPTASGNGGILVESQLLLEVDASRSGVVPPVVVVVELVVSL